MYNWQTKIIGRRISIISKNIDVVDKITFKLVKIASKIDKNSIYTFIENDKNTSFLKTICNVVILSTVKTLAYFQIWGPANFKAVRIAYLFIIFKTVSQQMCFYGLLKNQSSWMFKCVLADFLENFALILIGFWGNQPYFNVDLDIFCK